MRKYSSFLALIFLIFLSCRSRPAVNEDLGFSGEDAQTEVLSGGEDVFDPESISDEVFNNTLVEIQQLVSDLNRIIRAGNYNAWVNYLSDEYRRRINSKWFLDEIAERHPVFQGRLRNGQDYFRNVVVPSRANDRVDDIEFISAYQVRAYSEDAKGRRVVLYSLEDYNGKWIITD